MKLNLDNVPEKDNFTISEIAGRWDVDESVVEHFISDKSLRLAAYTKDLDIGGFLVNLNASTRGYLNNKLARFTWETIEKTGVGYAVGQRYKCIIEGTDFKLPSEQVMTIFSHYDDYPKYLYLPKYPFQTSEIKWPLTYQAGLFDGSAAYFIADFNVDFVTGSTSNFVLYVVRNDFFKYITKEERDRFEREYGITTETENVQKEVGKKTENKMLEVIQALAGALLKNGLSDNPHPDAEKVMKKLAAANQTLDCTRETLAKYLKANRL